MKKISFFVLMTTMLALTAPAMAQTAADSIYILREGFENGIPATWSQENVSGSVAWATETEGTYPTGASKGIGRAYLRNETTQTLGFVTRLITPAMDIKEVYQPILIFDRAQAQRTGDVDMLRVFYRTSSTGLWVFLKEYSTKSTNWKTDTIYLPSPTETYQIAFEGTDRLGRGIVLDDVRVRPKPTCNTPFNINTTSVGPNEASIMWNGSLDADSFRVVLSTSALTEEAAAQGDSAIVADVTTSQYFCSFSKLQPNTRYYVYIMSYCLNEQSNWGAGSFSTLNVLTLPYSYDFNFGYVSGIITRMDNWIYGTSLAKEDGNPMFTPYINTNVASTNWRYYSPDSTTSLWFNGGQVATLGRTAAATNNAVPATGYVYASTPELYVESMAGVQVSFWITAYTSVNSYYADNIAAGIIVGVMTDPNDWATFTPVDTFYAKIYDQFTYCVADLSSYTGTGKYLAFASDFKSLDNAIALDNMTISRPAVPTPSVKVSQVSPFNFMVDAGVAADSYNVKIASDKLAFNAPVGQAPAAKSVLASFTANSRTFSVPDTAYQGSFVNVYVQAVKNGVAGVWSEPVRVHVPTVMSLPMKYTFENIAVKDKYSILDRANRVWYTTSTYALPNYIMADPNWGYYYMPYVYDPSTGTDLITSGKSVLYWYYGGYAINFPYIDTLSNVLLTWNDACTNATYAGNGTIEVGVIDYPDDYSTFTKVAEFTPEYNVVNKRFVDFSSYAGNGHYVAFRLRRDNPSLTTNYAYIYIDDVKFVKVGGCPVASDFVVYPDVNEAILEWKTNEGTDWIVKYSSNAALKDTTKVMKTVLPTVDSASVTISGLQALKVYYYAIGAICGNDTNWSDTASFKTTCPAGMPLPYSEGFESPLKGNSSTYYGYSDIPTCWTMPQAHYNSTVAAPFMPFITTSSSYVKAGKQSLSFGSYYASTNASWLDMPEVLYFALPKMAKPINELKLSFYFRSYGTSYYGDTLEVGVMTDPEDMSTFTPVYLYAITQSNISTSWKLMEVDFYSYTGEDGYIAVRRNHSTATYHIIYIDDLTVEALPSCLDIDKAEMTAVGHNGLTMKVTTRQGDNFEVAVHSAVQNDKTKIGTSTTDFVYKHEFDSTLIVLNDTAILPGNAYYAYVRTLCSATDYSAWYGPIQFNTACLPYTPAEFNSAFGTLSSANQLLCWTMDLRTGTTSVPTYKASYKGSIYLYNNAASDGAYAITPELDVDSINHYSITFRAVSASNDATYVKKLTVGVITNPYDLSTFSPLKSFALDYLAASNTTEMGTENEYTVLMDNYNGDYNDEFGKQIMFILETDDKQGQLYIQGFHLDSITGCDHPANFEVDPRAHQASLSWDGTSDAYRVLLSSATVNTANIDTTKVLMDTVVTGKSVLCTGLTATTKYYVNIASICDGVSGEWSSEYNFTTEYEPFSLPYEDNFNSYTTGSSGTFPANWTKHHIGVTTAYPYINKINNEPALYMYHSSSYKIYAVLPRAGVPVNTTEMMLKYRYGSTSGSAAAGPVIGVAKYAEPYDSLVATFTPIDTLTLLTTDWKETIISFATYAGGGDFIAFKSNGASAYIDDISIDALPTCMYPLNVSVDSIDFTTAIVSWDGQGNNYDIYAAAGIDTIWYTASASPFQMTNLAPYVHYEVGVRQHCSEEDQSRYMKKKFTTKARIPFFENFSEEIPAVWKLYNQTMADVLSGTPLSIVQPSGRTTSWTLLETGNGIEGNHAVLNIYGTTKHAWMVSPSILVDDVPGLTFAFDAAYTKYNNANPADGTRLDDKFIVAVSEDDGLTWDSINTIVWSNDSLGDYVLNDVPATAIRYKFNFSKYIGKTIRIAFYGESSVSNGDNDFHIGNISLQTENCDGPTGLAVVDSTVTTKQAMLVWDADPIATSYHVIISSEADTSYHYDQVLTDTFVVVSGLRANTMYDVKLTMPCPNGSESSATLKSFTTSIGLPWSEDFAKAIPAAWTQYSQLASTVFDGGAFTTTGTGWSQTTVTTLGLKYNHVRANVYGASCYKWLVSPAIFVDSLENLHLSFDAALTRYSGTGAIGGNCADDKLIVAVSTDGGETWSSANTTVWASTPDADYVYADIPLNGTRYYIDFAPYIGKRVKIAFYGESTVSGDDNYLHLGRIKLNGDPICYAPMSVTAIADSLESRSAAISWSAKSLCNFEYKLKQDTTIIASGITADTLVSFQGLSPQTEYSFEVRSSCDSALFSDWNSVVFRTRCEDYIIGQNASWSITGSTGPDVEVNSGSYVYPTCWTVGNENSTTASSMPYIQPLPTSTSTAYVYGHDDMYGLRLYNTGTTSRMYAILPRIAGDLDTMQVTFWARGGYQTSTTGTSAGAYTDYAYPGSTSETNLIIGSVVDEDMSTFQEIDYYALPQHSEQVTNLLDQPDPEGTDYWREVTIPLYGATGTRICIILAHGKKTYDYMYIDDISVEPCHKPYPTGVKLLNRTPDLVDFTWNAPADSFRVTVGNHVMVVDTNYVAFTDLTLDSTYTFSVAAYYGTTLTKASSMTFNTPCGYAVPDEQGRYSWNFDNLDDVDYTLNSTSSSYVVPNCWISGNLKSTSYSYEPYIYYVTTGTSAYVCGYDGRYGLRLYGTKSYSSPYVVLPPINGLDSMQLTFWARGGYQTTAAGAYTNYSSYGHKMIIGTVTNPDDLSVIDSLSEYTAPAVTATNLQTAPDPAGTDYWRKVSVNLAGAKGKYIVLMLENEGASYDYLFLDNIQVKVNHCMMPDSVVVSDITVNSAKLSWRTMADTCRVSINGKDTLVAGGSLELTDLTANTLYSVSIVALCSEEEESDATVVDFYTAITTPYEEKFANGIPGNWTRYTELASTVLDGGSLTTVTTSGWLANTTTNGLPYNHVKCNIYGTSCKYWFVSPSILVDSLADIALAFDAALTDYGNALDIRTDTNGLKGVDDVFMVVISDDDGKTWKSANATVWNNDGTGDFVYNDVPYNGERYYINLVPFIGKTIRFAFYGESTVGNNADNDFHIGNVTIQSESCLPVRHVKADFANGIMDLQWQASTDSFQIQVAKDKKFVDSLLLVNTYLTDTAYSMALDYNSTYYYRVRSICDSVNNSGWINGSISTPLTIRFFEGVNSISTVPEGWTRTYNKKLSAAASSLGSAVTETATYGWRYALGGIGINSAHLKVTPYSSTYSSQWLSTPEIFVNAPDSVLLSFTCALTAYEDAGAPVLKGDEEFAVVVSTDGGKTWDIDNAILWSDTTAGAAHSFAAIPATATRQVVDLSRYAGQMIRLAFYAYGTQSTMAKSYAFHLDNIQLNTYEGVRIQQDLCQYEDFTYGNVTIDEERLPIGESTWYQFVPSSVDKKKDIYNIFDINVTEAVKTPIFDKVCYADAYQKYGFLINGITQEGIYKLKLQGVNTCDSIVELSIAINSASTGTDSATICTGSSYNWNGKEYNIAGLYTDTLVATATGCDSIVTFRLITNDPNEDEKTVYLCPNATLDFDGQQITAPGQYTKTYTNVAGCDSIVIWNVVAAQNESTLIRHLLCPGATYTDANFVGIGVAGDYKATIASTVTGCDSVINLHLVAVNNGEATDQIDITELPYELDGNPLLSADTKAGTYDFTVSTSCGQVTLHVVVKAGDGIDNVRFQDLNLAPNPTEIGKEVKILSSFNIGEQFTLEVFDATGAVVYSEPVTATRAAITVPGMPAAGIYMVRLTGDNTTYQSKLIVR